jgi:hypothetical protein
MFNITKKIFIIYCLFYKYNLVDSGMTLIYGVYIRIEKKNSKHKICDSNISKLLDKNCLFYIFTVWKIKRIESEFASLWTNNGEIFSIQDNDEGKTLVNPLDGIGNPAWVKCFIRMS